MHRLAPYTVLIIAISGFLLASAVRYAEAVCDGTCITLTKDEIATAAYGAGFRGGALVYSIAIAKAESDFTLNAINHANSNGSTDYGLWQINSVHVNNPPYYDANSLLYDTSYNAMAAYGISSAGMNWCPWVTFWRGDFISSLVDPARSAAQAIDSTVIRPITEEFSRVMATSDVNVRATTGGSLLRTVTAGTTGTVLDGPQVQSFGTCPNTQPRYYIWWKIHWDDGGEDGWSVEDAVARIDFGSAPPCHTILSGDPAPVAKADGTRYGLVWNWLSSKRELLLSATCNADDSKITAGSGNETGDINNNYRGLTYVWNKGYYHDNTRWIEINFSCIGTDPTPAGAGWCLGTAEGSIPTSSRWFLGYTCIWNGTIWQCGCTDEPCSSSFWQLQGIER